MAFGGSSARAPKRRLAQLAREADLRRRRLVAEPLLERCGVGREVDAGHRLAEGDVDEVQELEIALLDRAGIGLRAPAVAALDVLIGVLRDEPLADDMSVAAASARPELSAW